MFVRFVRLRVREGQESAFVEWYGARVIPALARTHGCVCAGLLTPWRSDEHRSLTIWRTAGAASAYERSGLFAELRREAEPMLARRDEASAPTTETPEATAASPIGGEAGELRDAEIRGLPPEGFLIDAGDGAANRLGRELDTAFVRFVSLRLAPDRIGEFVTLYSNRILPTLRAQAGYRGGFLAEERGDGAAFLSITLWDREEDAMRYEMSGAFLQLVDEVKETFSPVYAWQAALAGGREEDPRLAAPEVSSYQLVMSSRLNDDRR